MMMQFFFHDEFLEDNLMRLFLKFICDPNIAEKICLNMMFMVWGYNREQFNHTLLPAILNNDPSGTSAKVVVHFFQMMQSGKFRQYDYGSEKNLLTYNSVKPPDYNLANVMVPVALFYSKNDLLIVPEDIKRLYRILPNLVDMYEVPIFNHMDFIWSKDAPKLVYKRIFKLMKGENVNNATSML